MVLPLDGVLVADFSRVLAGPYASMLLADLGARVIKVERPEGDDTRHWGPPWTDHGASYFESANRGKESVRLDFTDEADRAAARELARRADVVIENFRPGALAKFGLDYDAVRETNPGVIYCSISGFGSDPRADMAGYDFLVQAVGGLMSITGHPDSDGGSPTKVGVALVDVLTGKDAALGILAGLHARARTGRGQLLETNLLSSLLASLVNQASAFLTTGRPPGRLGNAHPSIAPYELLPCREGHLAVACGNDGQFRRLSRVLGDESLADDTRFGSNSARVESRDELVRVLSALLASDSSDAWAARLSEVGVPAGTVGSVADGFALAEQVGLDPLVDVGPGRPRQVRHPIRFSDTPVTEYAAPPRLGEHDQAIRRWLNDKEAI